MITNEELEELLPEIIKHYGYDFTGYSRASLVRRVNAFFVKERCSSFADLTQKLLDNQSFFIHFVEEVTVNVTEMFRDPGFYKTLRTEIIPVLATYPFIRIWHAGCSTGEEVYSVAILLKEAGLLQKAILYATDLNQKVLEKAKAGIFPMSQMRQNSENYIKAGGRQEFSSYYTANYNFARFDIALSDKMVFSTHNLVSDSSFNEFQLILCRNVLIYFDKDLQARVLQLFDKSLDSLGFLALGSKESMKFSPIAPYYSQIETKDKIWRKKR